MYLSSMYLSNPNNGDLPVDPVAGVGEAKGELLLPGGQQQGRGDQHHRDLQQRHLRPQSLYAL